MGNQPEPDGTQGGRGNGLTAQSYVALTEVDPRLVDEVLDGFARHGIAAYTSPSIGEVGNALEIRMPARPLDRVYVDTTRRAEARQILDVEMPVLSAAIEEDVFQSIVAGFDTPAEPERSISWPVLEDLDDPPAAPPAERTILHPSLGQQPPAFGPRDYEPAPEDEHYVPPPLPPLPKAHPVTRWALLTIAIGLLLLVRPSLLLLEQGDFTEMLGVLSIAGGVATLIYRMRDDRGDDDDGAVV